MIISDNRPERNNQFAICRGIKELENLNLC
jgi:hypothetical protein